MCSLQSKTESKTLYIKLLIKLEPCIILDMFFILIEYQVSIVIDQRFQNWGMCSPRRWQRVFWRIQEAAEACKLHGHIHRFLGAFLHKTTNFYHLETYAFKPVCTFLWKYVCCYWVIGSYIYHGFKVRTYHWIEKSIKEFQFWIKINYLN